MRLVTLILIFFLQVNSHASENLYFQKGKIFLNEKKFLDAKFQFEKSLVINPKKVDSYLFLSIIFNHLKNYEEEKKNLKTVLILDPLNKDALQKISVLYANQGDYNNADKYYDILKKICSNNCISLSKLEDKIKKN